MSESLKTSTATDLVEAANKSAASILASLEQVSPTLVSELDGPLREVVLAAMAMSFNEGSLYGARRMAAKLT